MHFQPVWDSQTGMFYQPNDVETPVDVWMPETEIAQQTGKNETEREKKIKAWRKYLKKTSTWEAKGYHGIYIPSYKQDYLDSPPWTMLCLFKNLQLFIKQLFRLKYTKK